MGRNSFKGCNEDCFNCIYPDCKKLANKMKSTSEITGNLRANTKTGESQSRMFTLMLGKVSYTLPNAAKKYYR